VKTNETSLEEVACGKTFTPAVIVGIAYHEPGKYEEEVNGEIAVVDIVDYRESSGEGEPFVDMIP